MIRAPKDKYYNVRHILPLLIKRAIEKGVKDAHLDEVVKGVHDFNSGAIDHYGIDRTHYRTITYISQKDPQLFKNGIPEKAYEQLLETITS